MKKLLTLAVMLSIGSLAFAQPCTDFFFSEYIEGTGNNKALEIYNPTASPKSLNGYKVVMNYSNGGASDVFELPNVSVAAGDVYVIANNGASLAAITNAADTLLGFPSVVTFTGDDMVALVSGTDTIDIIGVFKEDGPGANGGWTVAGVPDATANHTLVRKPEFQQGYGSWDLAQYTWNVLSVDNVADIGGHTMNVCSTPPFTIFNFATPQNFYNEDAGTVTIDLTVNVNNHSGFTVDVVLKSGDATQLTGWTTQTASFSPNSRFASVNVTINDDAIEEPATNLTFALRNAATGILIGEDSIFTFTINPSDQLYTIATVRGNNTDGIPDSNGVICRVRGVVYGDNLSSGLNFTINDGTAGMGVFAPASVAGTLGYTVTEGDSIEVAGEVGDNKGQSQMSFLSGITLLASGQSLPAPTVVTGPLGEDTEGELIVIENVEIVNSSSTGAGITYEGEVGSQEYEIFVDTDANITVVLEIGETYNVTGIGTQFGSGNPPFTSGYQITPRRNADLSGSSSVAELKATDVKVYPNPVGNIINVATQVSGLTKVQLFDVTGRMVVEQNLELNNTKVDVSGLNAGIYMLQATGNNQVFNTRVVKQ